MTMAFRELLIAKNITVKVKVNNENRTFFSAFFTYGSDKIKTLCSNDGE